MTEFWRGCHGVAVDGADLGVGTFRGNPMVRGTLRYGDVAPGDGVRLWSQDGEAATLWRRDDGRLVLAGPTATALEVDPGATTVTVAPGDPVVQRQLVASFGLPLLLHGRKVLLLHGSACARDGQAIVVCGDSGSGKSSTLVRLVDEGWESISEDLCAVDLRGERPRVWPGPPWVRVAHGESGPRGTARAFDSEDKTAWDVSARHAQQATELTRIVLLEAPGGEEPVREALARADALRTLARHAVWLEDPADRGRRLFGAVAAVAAQVPAVGLRLPRSDEWLDSVPGLVTAAAT